MSKYEVDSSIPITEELTQTLIQKTIDGTYTLMDACVEAKVEYIKVWKTIQKSAESKEMYACARQDYARNRVQEAYRIGRDEPDTNRARILIDLIKWETSKVLPREFGDKMQVSGDPDGQPVQVSVVEYK